MTTGDIDGDKRDEAIVGFRLGDPASGQAQLLVLKYTGQDTKGNTDPLDDKYSMDTRVFLTENLWQKYSHYFMAALSVSLAAGDMDGDGIDEIALGIGSLLDNSEHGDRIWETYLATYDYVPTTAPEWQSLQVPGRPGLPGLSATIGVVEKRRHFAQHIRRRTEARSRRAHRRR